MCTIPSPMGQSVCWIKFEKLFGLHFCYFWFLSWQTMLNWVDSCINKLKRALDCINHVVYFCARGMTSCLFTTSSLFIYICSTQVKLFSVPTSGRTTYLTYYSCSKVLMYLMSWFLIRYSTLNYLMMIFSRCALTTWLISSSRISNADHNGFSGL